MKITRRQLRQIIKEEANPGSRFSSSTQTGTDNIEAQWQELAAEKLRETYDWFLAEVFPAIEIDPRNLNIITDKDYPFDVFTNTTSADLKAKKLHNSDYIPKGTKINSIYELIKVKGNSAIDLDDIYKRLAFANENRVGGKVYMTSVQPPDELTNPSKEVDVSETAMKITRRQLRQIIKEEFSILENQEGTDIKIPTEEELRVMLTDAGVAVTEQAEKIEYFLRKFAEDHTAASKEIVDMYSEMGNKIIDAGESAHSWLEKNVLAPARKGLANPTPDLPSSNEGSKLDETKESKMKITRKQLRRVIQETIKHSINESSREGHWYDAGYEDGSDGSDPKYMNNMAYMDGYETGLEDYEHDIERGARVAIDTDRDGIADFADTDQDNDGQVDILQGQRDIVHVRAGEVYEEDFLEADFAVWLGKNQEFTRVAAGTAHPLDANHAVDNESWWVDGPEDGPSRRLVGTGTASNVAEVAQMPDSWARILGNCLGDKN